MKLNKITDSPKELIQSYRGPTKILGIGSDDLFNESDLTDIIGPKNNDFGYTGKVWTFEYQNHLVIFSHNNQLKRMQISVQSSGKDDPTTIAKEIRTWIVSEFKKNNPSKHKIATDKAKMNVVPGFIKESMFDRYSNLFSKPIKTHDRTPEFNAEVSVWKSGMRGVIITINHGPKIVWEHKSNNPNTLQNDIKKMEQMITSMHLDLNTIRIVHKLNGRIVDVLGESIIEEARQKKIQVPKRKGLNVGDTSDINDKQIEIILPRDDLETRKSLLKPLIDSGHKIVGTVRNGRMDIMTLTKPNNLTEEVEEVEELDEFVLNAQQRRARGRIMKKNKTRLKMARDRKSKRLATNDQLLTRARRMAIQIVRRRFAGKMGQDYKSLSVGQKIQVDKRIESKKGLVKRIAQRILPRVRKMELERYRRKTSNQQKGTSQNTESN